MEITKKIAFLFLALNFAATFSFAQGTKIIALNTNDNNNKGAIMAYDFVSKNYDTLLTFPSTVNWVNEECAIDGFNGRYFFCGNVTGYANYTIFSYNVSSGNLTPLFVFGFFQGQNGIEYDCFSNSLVFKQGDSLRRFNMSTGTISTICKIPCASCGSLYAGFMRAYNYLDQKYLYVTALPGTTGLNCALVDVANAVVTATTAFGGGHYFTYDLTSNSFYCSKGSGAVYKIDPVNGNDLNCGPVLPYNAGLLNRQTAVFDSYTGRYIQPYSASASNGKLAITTINTSSFTIIDSFPNTSDFHRLYSAQKALIKQQGNILIASYGASYQWYVNDSLIVGATSQTYSPNNLGNYTVKQTHFDNRNSTSNVVSYSPVGLSGHYFQNADLIMYPNPVTKNNILRSERPLSDATIQIYNAQGQLIKQLSNISGQTILSNHDDFKTWYLLLRDQGK